MPKMTQQTNNQQAEDTQLGITSDVPKRKKTRSVIEQEILHARHGSFVSGNGPTKVTR